jgi:hypothetical protein
MRQRLAWVCMAGIVVACALPKVDVDPSLAPDGGTSGGKGGTAASGGSTGQAGPPGSGGSSANAQGQGGNQDDEREIKCYDYCTTYIANCSDSPANTYTGLDDCLNTCFSSDWPLGPDPAQPNSIQCRVVHAHLARDLPDPHCFHSAKVPSGTFCAL